MKAIFFVFAVMFGLSLLTNFANADIDIYEFSSEDVRDRYTILTKELRCPKCQNQDIADSNAPIAQDMRREVHRMVEGGHSVESVVAHMVERFGEFVSYKPKVGASTYLLWYGPLFLIVLGLITVASVSVRRKAIANEEPLKQDLPLSQEESAKVAALLGAYDDEPSLEDPSLEESNINLDVNLASSAITDSKRERKKDEP